MSSIVRLTIKGVRSFDHEEEQSLKFLKPLTVVTGHNGTGKTTIIECLRYVCSGILPPRAQSSFAHDLKNAGSSEMEGYVDLIFKDRASNPIAVRRRFKSFKKMSEKEFQNLSSTIEKKDEEGTMSLSRCHSMEDLNEQIVDGLGVSQAVMLNVLFCHQDESNWPLDEGNQLEEKFNEIFGATRYIKSLENIMMLRKKQSTKINELKLNAERHREWKNEAKQVTRTLEKNRSDLSKTKRQVSECIFQLKQKEEMLQEIQDKDSHFQELNTRIGELTVSKEKLQSSCKEIEAVCQSGNVEKLAREINEQKKMKAKKEKEYGKEVKVLNKLKEDEKALEIEKGRLEQEQKQFEELQQNVWECVRSLSSAFTGTTFNIDWNSPNLLVDDLKQLKSTKELQLDNVSEEILKLSQNQNLKLGILQEEIQKQEEAIDNIRNHCDSEVMQLLQTFPLENVYSQLDKFYWKQKHKVEQARANLQVKNLDQCREECTKQQITEQLEKKQKKLDDLEQQLRNECGNREAEGILARATRQLREKQRSIASQPSTCRGGKSPSTSSGVDVKCPLCNKAITGNKTEVENFKDKLKEKVPSNQNITSVANQGLPLTLEEYFKMKETPFLVQKITKLSGEVLGLKIKLKAVEENVNKLKAETQKEEKNVRKLQDDESLAIKLMPDIYLIDHHVKVISKLTCDIAAVQESRSAYRENLLKTLVKQQKELQKQVCTASDGLCKLELYFQDMSRFSTLSESLQKNKSGLQKLKESVSQETDKVWSLFHAIAAMEEDINMKQDEEERLHYCKSQLRTALLDVQTIEQQLYTALEDQRKTKDSLVTKQAKEDLMKEIANLNRKKSEANRRLGVLKEDIDNLENKLVLEKYTNADENYRKCIIDLKTTQIANKDLKKYQKALNWAIIKFHKIKMEEINKIIYDLWAKIYKGNDIDFIKILFEVSTSSETSPIFYCNYTVVMVTDGLETDMTGHCSAGQKVLASLIIRLALAETFSLSCGVLALDEPTANLDYENKKGLALALSEILDYKMKKYQQSNFQLIIITHDQTFVEMFEGSGYTDQFYQVSKDQFGNSIIILKTMCKLQR